MANGKGGFKIEISPEAWRDACIAAGYTVRDGMPVLGISGDNDGFLVTLGVPSDLDPVNFARALCSHALRVGQAKVKAKGSTPSRDLASDGANSALNGSYSPARERENDILTRESENEFGAYVRDLVKKAKPDATEEDIAATVKQYSESDSGKAWIENRKNEIFARGTYSVSRKGSGGKATVVAITLP